MKVKEGDRVRVVISKTSELWNQRALMVVQGAVGVVESVSTHHGTGHPRERPYVCVRFDSPLPKTWKWGHPISAHHFDDNELEVLP